MAINPLKEVRAVVLGVIAAVAPVAVGGMHQLGVGLLCWVPACQPGGQNSLLTLDTINQVGNVNCICTLQDME